MTTAYPPAIDALSNPAPTDTLADSPHSDQHADVNDAVEAVETKLGTGASVPTTVGHIATVTGAGATAWQVPAAVAALAGHVAAGDPHPVYATDADLAAAIATAVTGLLDFKGSTDCSGTPNYPAASKGDAYLVSVAGKIGGASGTSVDVGDMYVAIADNAGGTQAAVGTSWTVIEHNLPTLGTFATISSLAHSATTGKTADDHHNQSHAHSAAGDGTALAPAQLRVTAELSPPALTANTHNWNPTGLSTAFYIRVQHTGGPWQLTGIAAQPAGTLLWLWSVAVATTLKSLNGSSSTANQFLCPGNADYVIGPYASALLRYSGTESAWIPIKS